jgi:transposase
MQKEGVICDVIAPSLIPVKPGERVKTDRRDARKLAEYHRQGILTTVHPPTKTEESVRDLCRCREAAKTAQKRARQQLLKYLLRQGRFYSEGSHWTQKHHRWLRQQTFDDRAAQYVFEDYLAEVERCGERVEKLEGEIERVAQTPAYQETVGWLRCFRGIDTVTAMTILTELFCFERFREPKQLMAFLGMTPGEHSSGGSQRKGPITKTGNGRVRRILIEAAWHQRHWVRVGKALKQRRQGQPAWVIAAADKAMRRLHKKYHSMIAKGKSANVAVTAVAREMVGFIWSVLFTRVETAAAQA